MTTNNFCDDIHQFYEKNVFSKGSSISAVGCDESKTDVELFDTFCQVGNDVDTLYERSCLEKLKKLTNEGEDFLYSRLKNKTVEEWDISEITPQFHQSIVYEPNIRLMTYLKNNILVLCGISNNSNSVGNEFIKYIDLFNSPNKEITITDNIVFNIDTPLVDVSSNGFITYSKTGEDIVVYKTKIGDGGYEVLNYNLSQHTNYQNVKSLKIQDDGSTIFIWIFDESINTNRILKLNVTDNDPVIQQIIPSASHSIPGINLPRKFFNMVVSGDATWGISAHPYNTTTYRIHILSPPNSTSTQLADWPIDVVDRFSFTNMFLNDTCVIGYYYITDNWDVLRTRHIVDVYHKDGQIKNLSLPIDYTNPNNSGIIGVTVSDIGDKAVLYVIHAYDFSSTKYRLYKSSEFTYSDIDNNNITWTQPYPDIFLDLPTSNTNTDYDLLTITNSIASSKNIGKLVYTRSGCELYIQYDITEIMNIISNTSLKLKLSNNGLLQIKNSDEQVLYSSNTSDSSNIDEYSGSKTYIYENDLIGILSPNELYWVQKLSNNRFRFVLNPVPTYFLGEYSRLVNGNYDKTNTIIESYCNSVGTTNSAICLCRTPDAILESLYNLAELKENEALHNQLERIAHCLAGKCDPKNFIHDSFTYKMLRDKNCPTNIQICDNALNIDKDAHFSGNVHTECGSSLKCTNKICPTGSECDETTGNCHLICSDHAHCPDDVECDFTNGTCKKKQDNTKIFIVTGSIIIVVVLILLYLKYK